MSSIFKKKDRGPYIIAYFDHTGRRRERSSRTTDKSTAQRIAGKLEAGVALRRDGVVDPQLDRYAEENRKALSEHVRDYLNHCRHAGRSAKHVVEKVRHLDALIAGTGATRLSELTADSVEKHLQVVKANGYSARTINFRRQIAVAFFNWCVKNRRAESNPLSIVSKLDEERDRRRVRRALTADELSRLLTVAESRGRKLWYLTAALAGLRRSELERLRWGDVDFEDQTITVRDGKARHIDVIPMHPQLADELARDKEIHPALPTANVFPESVTNITVQKDLLRAGLARFETVNDSAGNPRMIGTGMRMRPKTRIVTRDEEGRVIDLHAMRTTLGTNLARAGVAPQIAQRIMRHAEYKTTLKHYTVLGLADTSSAIRRLPGINESESQEAKAYGTCDPNPQQIPQQSECFSQPISAKVCEEESSRQRQSPQAQVFAFAEVDDDLRNDTTQDETAGDATRTRNVQLGRLMLYH